MISMKDIPTDWLDILAEIQVVCPSAVIAGGALRDLWLGVPVKDIDIFIECGGMDEAEGLFQKLGGQPPEKEWDAGLSDVTEAGLYPESMKEVILVEDYPRETKDGLPVQLIFVNWKTHRITARFDIGICRIATDGTTLTVDEGFDEDVMNKALNIRRCNNKWMLGASISRIIRLLKKYPDWTIQLEGVKIKEVDDD